MSAGDEVLEAAVGGRSSRSDVLVAVEGVSKSYDVANALADVAFRVAAGEVVGLLGANGAGKSTLLGVLGGTVVPDVGSLWVGGDQVALEGYSPVEARRRGIQRVFQELSVFPNLSVAENFSLTRERGERTSKGQALREARRRLDEVFPKNRISPNTEVGLLSLAEQQMVEIARAATESGIRLLILDEPTSALSAEGAEQLADFIRCRTADGLAVIYVTHKLDEVTALATRIVVLRDGFVRWEGDGRSATHDDLLVQLGAVPAETAVFPLAETTPNVAVADEVLVIEGLPGLEAREARLVVHRGETVGLAGLEGAGQRPLLQRVFAHRNRHRGHIRLAGDVAYVSGDRQREGVLPLWSVRENIGISALDHASTAGFVRGRRLRAIADTWLENLGLTARAHSLIGELSGGNQQRALLGRALASDADLLLLDDPTRGVDVGAKREIYEILDRARREGRSALLYSTENAEFLQCDRVYVMSGGSIVAEIEGVEATEGRIVQASYARPGTRREATAGIGGRAGAVVGSLLSAVGKWPPAPAAILFVAMLAAVFAVKSNATSPAALNLLVQSSTIMALAAMAQMIFILGGDFDLGLGFAIGFVNVVGATLLATRPVVGVAAILAVVVGYVAMALLVELLGVPSVVVTLGASFVWLGLGMLLQDVPGGAAPGWLTAAVRKELAPVPENAWFLIATAVVGVLVVSVWRYGTILRALGANRKTLVDLGYSALLSRIILYLVASLFVVAAGLMVAAQTTSSDINASAPLTLGSVAAVIVGGASFSGGRVSPVGAVLAAVALSLIASLLVLLGVSSQYSTALGGIVLILVLGLRAVAGRGRR